MVLIYALFLKCLTFRITQLRKRREAALKQVGVHAAVSPHSLVERFIRETGESSNAHWVEACRLVDECVELLVDRHFSAWHQTAISS